MVHTLYLCYFGLREPLVQTQVLPYLRELQRDGLRVSLLTFEPTPPGSWPGGEAEARREALAAEGVRWHWLRYHKRPSLPATAFDVLAGARFVRRLARADRVDVIHARAHVAAMMGALVKRRVGARLLFDIRGFNAEESVDAGRWRPGGLKFRVTKRAERAIFPAADGFVVLTERARDVLFPAGDGGGDPPRPVEVIPCCVDTERFAAGPAGRDATRRALGLDGRRAVVYLGALGGWYMTEEMADFFATAVRQDPSTTAVVLTQSPPEMIVGPLRRRGLTGANTLVRRVDPLDVPRHLAACDVAVSFIRPCYSKLSSSPTKIAEYLVSGLPVVSTAGIGDLDGLIEGDRVGVLVRGTDEPSYLAALGRVDALRGEAGFAERCRETARRRFDLRAVGGARYRRLYRRLLDGPPAGPAHGAGAR